MVVADYLPGSGDKEHTPGPPCYPCKGGDSSSYSKRNTEPVNVRGVQCAQNNTNSGKFLDFMVI